MKTRFKIKCRAIAILWFCVHSMLASIVIDAESRGGSGYNGCFYDGGWIVNISGTDYVVAAVDYNIKNTNGNSSDYTGIVSLKTSLSSGRRVYYIGDKAFKYGRNMTHLCIPSSIGKIESGAFANCYGLKVLLKSSPIFDDHLNYNCTLYVPEGKGSRYQSVCSKVIDGFISSGQSFSGSGAGTKDDPFLVFNPIQLNQVRNFLDEKWVHFKLMSDIDLTGWIEENNPSQGWQPIGTESSPFMGIFDGNNHKITGLRINRSSTDDVGFFGYMLWAEVSNLTIEGCDVKGYNNVGTLAGRAIDCDINNFNVRGTITASGNNAGGFLGCASGNVSDCTSSVTIIGNNRIGGFVGSSFDGQGAELHFDNCTFVGEISGEQSVASCLGYTDHDLFVTNFSSMGNIVCNGNYAAGIVGFSCGELLEVLDSYSLCDIVSHGNYVGGIVGYWLTRDYPSLYTVNIAKNSIKSSYYNGSITIDGRYLGGIFGYDKCREDLNTSSSSLISNCYSYANLIGDSYVGGIAGYASGSTIKSNVSICGLVSAVSGNVGRIYGSDDLSDVTLGETGTANENKGLATASVLLNGVAQDLPDGLKHGTNVGSVTLKLKATYQGMGWDFNDWTMVETESYPYKPVQCAPPVVTSILEAKATEVSGNSIDGGTVKIVAGGKEYTTQTSDNLWVVQVDPLQAGSVVKAQADTEDKLPSYFELKTVGFGGNGTEEDPYSIYTAEDLQNINSYKYYRLMADIDLTEWINENNPSGGWIPIGASGNATMKQLDGNGHKITGLWCDNDMENCGLFATTNNATIRDLTINIANGKKVKGGTNTGALVGYAEATQLTSIIIYGNVEGSENTGGIVGYCETQPGSNNYNKIKSCYFNGFVKGNYHVGGLVGQLSGDMSECYSQGTVIGTGETCFVGGIVGLNRFYVVNCYSDATVNAGSNSNNSSNQYAGGIVGENSHTVFHCYATGDLFAVKCAAGIAGYNTSSVAVVYECYAMNRKIEVADASGIAMRVIGGIRNGAPTPGADNYALNTMVVSVNNIPQIIYDDLLHGQSLTDAVLKKEITYHDNGWDMDSIWNINEDESYPYLRSVEIQDVIEPEPDIVRGDANGDGDVTITDVVLAAQVAVGKTPNIFIEANADVNGDGTINITDVVIIANIAVGKMTTPRKAPAIGCDNSNQLSASRLDIKSGETQTIEIMLDNTIDFCGFQMDVELPEGLELVDAHLSNRADSHDLLIGGEQTLNHLLAFSLGNNVFNGSTGALLTLILKANQDFNSSMEPNLSNILFVEPNGNTLQMNDMVIPNRQTFVNEVNETNVRIFGERNMIIIDSPVNGKAQVVSTSGVTQWVDIHAGHNEIHIQQGVYVVRMGNKVVKLKF